MYENLFKSPLHRVFLYGTLKRGEPNHEFICNKANGYAKFLGIGKTVDKYPLVIATRYNIPFLLHKPGIGNQVLGEVYDVDSKMLERMDAFEEHPDFYTRMDADVYLAPDKPNFDFESEISCAVKAGIYFLPKFKSTLLELPMYGSYSSSGNHGLKYAERSHIVTKHRPALLQAGKHATRINSNLSHLFSHHNLFDQ